MNGGGTILSATYLGGTNGDSIFALAIDGSGNIYAAGITNSSDFPVTAGALQTTYGGSGDAFVSKLNSSLSALLYSTYLGGSAQDFASGLQVDGSGDAFLTGSTQSTNFPTTPGAFSPTLSSSCCYAAAFVSKLNATGTALTYSTYVGGQSYSNLGGKAVAVDSAGDAVIFGSTTATNLPTTPGALMNQHSGSLFLSELSPSGSSLTYSTYFGSNSSPYYSTSESAGGLALDGNGAAYIAGVTAGPSFPVTPSAFQIAPRKNASTVNGLTSAFVSKIDLSSPTVCNVVLSANSAAFPGRGGMGSFTFSVAPGCPWVITSDPFITVHSPLSGIGSGTVNYTAAQNPSTYYPQTGSITVNGGVLSAGTNVLAVSQAAGSCTDPVFDQSTLAFDPSGGIRNVAVSLPGGCAWNVQTPPWMTVTSSTTGPGTLSLYVTPNSYSQRQGTVMVATKAITVTQPGGSCVMTPGTGSVSFAAVGGTGAIPFTTGASCAWAAYVNVPWIRIASQSASGQGSGALPVTVASNPGWAPRTGIVTLADQTLQITQSAGPVGYPASYTLSVFAGSTSFGFGGDGGPAVNAQLSNPSGLVFDGAGNLFISDQNNNRVRRVDLNGIITTFAGGGSSLGDGGPAASARLSSPAGLAIDANGNIYIAELGGNRVRKVATNGIISTFAGTGTAGFSGDGGPATAATMSGPLGLANDASGNLYIADSGNDRIRQVSGGNITTIAGTGTYGSSGDGGAATAAALVPTWLSLDSNANLYVTDSASNRVRKNASGVITNFAGGGTSSADNVPATTAPLGAAGTVVDGSGAVYVADRNTNRVRRITTDGMIASLPLTSGSLYPIALALDLSGAIYESDAVFYSQVSKLTPDPAFCTYTVSTTLQQTSAGSTFTPTVTTQSGCQWSASSATSWITLSNNSFTVSPNTSGAPRSGIITVAGQNFTITQAAPITVPTVFVTALYQDLLNRAPDTAGLNYWLTQLNAGTVTRAQLAAQFFNSTEFSSSGLYVIKLYTAILNRDPDFAGWSYWFGAMGNGTPAINVLNAFLSSNEFQSTYGTITSNTAFVTLVYNNVLGRAPDSGGLSYWVGLLNAGTITRGGMMDQFVRSSEYGTSIRARAYANLLYMGFLRRTADAAGLAYWTGILNDPNALPMLSTPSSRAMNT